MTLRCYAYLKIDKRHSGLATNYWKRRADCVSWNRFKAREDFLIWRRMAPSRILGSYSYQGKHRISRSTKSGSRQCKLELSTECAGKPMQPTAHAVVFGFPSRVLILARTWPFTSSFSQVLIHSSPSVKLLDCSLSCHFARFLPKQPRHSSSGRGGKIK